MAAPEPEDGASGPGRGLKLFLIGVRLVGLLGALLISNLHAKPLVMGETLKNIGWVVAVGVAIYHALAVVVSSYSRSSVLQGFIIAFDVLLGAGLTYLYGESYFILTFALPVLEVCASFGITAAMVSGVLGIMFYSVVFARPLLDSLHNNILEPENFSLKLSLAGVQFVCSLLLVWLYTIAVFEGVKSKDVKLTASRSNELLYRQLSQRSEENELILAELSDKEQKVTVMGREIAQLQRELDEAYKDVAKARMAVSSKQSQAEEKVTRISDEMLRERQSLEDRTARLEQDLNSRSQTLEGFRQISASLSLEETLLALVYHLQTRFPSTCCVVFMLEDVQGTRYLYPEVADAGDTEFFRELAIPVGEQAIGWVALNGRSLRINDKIVDTDSGPVEALPEHGRSALVVPMLAGEGSAQERSVLGVVYLSRNEAGGYRDGDLSQVEEFLEFASIAVARCLEFRYRVGGGPHDPVTGLHNDLYLSERLEDEVRRGRRYTYPVSLLLIDIDGFSAMMERLGAEVLDNVLRQLAGLLIEATRDTDTVARIDADDFGILLVHSERDNAIPIAERIRQEVSQTTFGSTGHPLRLTVSVGIAGVPHDASDAQRLREAALGALSQARSGGGNAISVYHR